MTDDEQGAGVIFKLVDQKVYAIPVQVARRFIGKNSVHLSGEGLGYFSRVSSPPLIFSASQLSIPSLPIKA